MTHNIIVATYMHLAVKPFVSHAMLYACFMTGIQYGSVGGSTWRPTPYFTWLYRYEVHSLVQRHIAKAMNTAWMYTFCLSATSETSTSLLQVVALLEAMLCWVGVKVLGRRVKHLQAPTHAAR
jgi:hypothetical protein